MANEKKAVLRARRPPRWRGVSAVGSVRHGSRYTTRPPLPWAASSSYGQHRLTRKADPPGGAGAGREPPLHLLGEDLLPPPRGRRRGQGRRRPPRPSSATLCSRIDRAVRSGASTATRAPARRPAPRAFAPASRTRGEPARAFRALFTLPDVAPCGRGHPSAGEAWGGRRFSEQTRVPRAHGVRRRAGRHGGHAAGGPDPGPGGAGGRAEVRAAEPAQPRDRPLRDPDDGEPVVRPLLRLARPPRRTPARTSPTPRRPGSRWRPATPRPWARPSGRDAGTPTPGTGGTRAAPSSATGSSPRTPATTSSRSPTTTRASWASSTTRPRPTRPTTATSARSSASTWPNRYYKWSAQSGGIDDNTPPVATAGNQWETIFDRAIPRGVTARYYNSDLPFSAVWGARGGAVDEPDHALLRRLRGRDAAEHHDRGPALPGRRRLRRHVGRRAPARRRAARPGVHGRRGPRVRGVALLRARRAVRDLRRMGRLLRPREAAERARRPPDREPRHRLRPDGLPDARRWPCRRTRAGGREGEAAHRCAWTTGCTATSRSSS